MIPCKIFPWSFFKILWWSASSIYLKLKRECQKALQSETSSSNPPPHELHLEPGQYTVSTHHPHNEEKTCKWQISEALTGRKLKEGPLVNLQQQTSQFWRDKNVMHNKCDVIYSPMTLPVGHLIWFAVNAADYIDISVWKEPVMYKMML